MTYRINPHEVGNDSLHVIYDHQLREMRDEPDEGYPLGISGSEVRVPLGMAAVDEDTWKASREALKQCLIDAFHQVDETTHDLDIDMVAHEASEALYGYVMAHWPIPESLKDMEDDYIRRIEDWSGNLLRVEVSSLKKTHLIDASTTDEKIHQLASLLAQEAREDNILLLDAEECLTELRDEVRSDDPEWGPLTPYLERLLEEGSPAVRRKNPGPYNPERKRTILIATGATRGNEGNWTPAILHDSDEAIRQWDLAGLDYPLKAEASQRRFGDLMRQLPQREKHRIEQRQLPAVADQRRVVKDIRKQIAQLDKEIERLLESNNIALSTSLIDMHGMMRSRHLQEIERKRLIQRANDRIATAMEVVKDAMGDLSRVDLTSRNNPMSKYLRYLNGLEASERLAPHIQGMITLIEDHQVQCAALQQDF